MQDTHLFSQIASTIRLYLEGRGTGLVLIILSAFAFSTAGIFTNGVTAGAWDIIFWRGVSASFGATLYLGVTGNLRSEFVALRGRRAGVTWSAALMMAAGAAAFIPAFKLTGVANTTLIYASAPFLTAGLAWLVLKETPMSRVLVASGLALIGVGIIVSASLSAASVETKLFGDGLALFMTCMMAGQMVLYRARPETPNAVPSILSSLILLPGALILGAPFVIPLHEILITLTFGLVFALAAITLAEGAKRLPSSETALLSSLETPLAPLLAWLFLAESPTLRVLTGGGVVFAAVLWSQTRGRDAG